MAEKKQKWLLTHDSHELKKGDIYEGVSLPLWLNGKAQPLAERTFEVATPDDLGKLQADLTEANDKVAGLAEENQKLQADLTEAQKQIAELQKKAK
jgi:predicted RNase H-like nuclease (RuvC/YqgF family)